MRREPIYLRKTRIVRTVIRIVRATQTNPYGNADDVNYVKLNCILQDVLFSFI